MTWTLPKQFARVCLFIYFLHSNYGYQTTLAQSGFSEEESEDEPYFTIRSCYIRSSTIDCKSRLLDEFPTWDGDKIPIPPSVELYLNFNKISKVTQIKNSSEISAIFFNGNLISDIESYAFTYLPNLKTLNLYNNQLYKINPDAFKTMVGSPLPLESLDLSHNHITRLPQDVFDDLTKLKHLNLFRNKISHLASSGLNSLNSLVSLETLNLSRNDFSDIGINLKATVSRVQLLDLSLNSFTRVPEVLKHGKDIRTLIFSENSRISEFDALSFLGLENLQELEINKMDNLMVIRNGTFTPLKSLEYLYCSRNQRLNKIEGSSFANNFGGHACLKQVDLSNNNISTLDVGLFKNLSLCEIDLTGNPLKCACDIVSLIDVNIRIEKICRFYPENGDGQSFVEMNITSIDAFCVSGGPPSNDLFWATIVILLGFLLICLAAILTRHFFRNKSQREEVIIVQFHMVCQYTTDPSGENFEGKICTEYTKSP